MKQKFTNRPGADQHRYRPDVVWTFTVPDNSGTEPQEPLQLLSYLISVLTDQKRTSVKEMLKHNQVLVNGQIATQHNTALNPGDVVKVNFTREFRVFRHRRMQIVYEDDDIIVAHKGYGLLSMGTGREQHTQEETAYSILREYVKWQNPRNKIFIVHRLDRDTSGLMLFAKTVEAKESLQHNWNNMVLQRKYVALVEGTPDPAEGTVRSYLKENSKHEVYSVKEPADDAQLAVTRYRTLRSGGGYSLMEVELDTGRKNQIRVHMKDLGHPIAGDRRYGASRSPLHRLALHAQTLRFVHPVTRKDMNFSTPVPPRFLSAL